MAVLLTVAPNGARRQRNDHPSLPLDADELAADAKACVEAGATLCHMHVRDTHGRHLLDAEAFQTAIDAVRAAVGDRLMLQVTTEALGHYDVAAQTALIKTLRPEAVSLALREFIPDENHPEDAAALFAWLRDEGIAPQFILYAPGDVSTFHRLRRQGMVPQAKPFVLFVLGSYDGEVATYPRDLLPFLSAHDQDCPWGVCAFGKAEMACALTAVALEGHARVGFENNLVRPDGAPLANNAEQVARLAEGVRLLGHRPMTIDETRRFVAETAA